MEENQSVPKVRKLRKIKKSKPQDQPMSFGAPTKVNYSQPDSFLEDAFNQKSGENTVFDDNGDAENIHFITEEELIPQTHDSISILLRNKTVFMLLIIAGLIGAITGYLLAPSANAPAARGLDGVVINSDIPAGRSRCGIAEPHQGCVLYIMNPKNQEVQGKYFYNTAAKWTNRERYLIETSNMHYSSTRIKPGYIAQINIPPLTY
ncbi:MAG: hypothetical protein IJS88_00065 [Alphaproteobacteria bacterium]|nr:hypothetical protein [Alphaproteobacteria bacterium]